MNYLRAEELAVVSPNVLDGLDRYRTFFTPEEYFVEGKIMDSPYYDFMSVRAGSQFFTSDFRGFIFSDTNRAVRLFGTRDANRDQYNLIWFDQTEKDTNSTLNRIDKDRHQNTWIANYYRNDFLYPGNNLNLSFHYNHDKPSTEFDRNGFLVRPDPVGVFAPHDIKSYYFGTATNGHIERFNLSTAFYYVLGRDSLNPIAGRRVDISAYMAAVELSYDRDWSASAIPISSIAATTIPTILAPQALTRSLRTRTSLYRIQLLGRQGIRLFGVELTNRLSLNPSMRNGKFQAQQNFVNPGLHLYNWAWTWTSRHACDRSTTLISCGSKIPTS